MPFGLPGSKLEGIKAALVDLLVRTPSPLVGPGAVRPTVQPGPASFFSYTLIVVCRWGAFRAFQVLCRATMVVELLYSSLVCFCILFFVLSYMTKARALTGRSFSGGYTILTLDGL